MNVLSLFDGMSCGQIALNRLGIKYDNYFASEIDQPAINVTKYNFPETNHIGSVLGVKGRNLPKIDLLFGGSPCQDLSAAGKRAGINGSKSSLFFIFVDIYQGIGSKIYGIGTGGKTTVVLIGVEDLNRQGLPATSRSPV